MPLSCEITARNDVGVQQMSDFDQLPRGLPRGETRPSVVRRALSRGSSSEPAIQMARQRSCKAASSREEAVINSCGGYSGADGGRRRRPWENVCGMVGQVDATRDAIGCSDAHHTAAKHLMSFRSGVMWVG